MASQQWKVNQGFLGLSQTPPKTFIVGSPTYQPTTIPFPQSPPKSSAGFNCHSVYSPPSPSNGPRETGIIEKLLQSYGFVQCCDRADRLFFHFSQFNGEIEQLKIGDGVEFEQGTDRRTNKPIAVKILKLPPGAVATEVLSDECYLGDITVEPKYTQGKVPASNSDLGRVTFERSGECFFLPFTVDDIIGANTLLHQGDQVSFRIATDKRTGAIRAREIQLVRATTPPKFLGIIASIKDNFGFIERADSIKQIFFHYSEYHSDVKEMKIGDNVEFKIQTRNGKDVAVDIIPLPLGTVLFEEILPKRLKGRISQPLIRPPGRRPSDPCPGRISYSDESGKMGEIMFGDRDQSGDWTLFNDDLVEFNLAVDKRDAMKRATNIELLTESFIVRHEKREQGVAQTLKDGFGFIKCCERDTRLFFHYSELLSKTHELQNGDELEFTVFEDPGNVERLLAVRIKVLSKNTVCFHDISKERYRGNVARLPRRLTRSRDVVPEPDQGIVSYTHSGDNHSISFLMKDVEPRSQLGVGDQVEFNISVSKRNGVQQAIDVVAVSRCPEERRGGFIATIKESFGFIETSTHDKEIFFHFSELEGQPGDFQLGDEVEYNLSYRGIKVCAEKIKKVTQGTVAPETLKSEIQDGYVVRPLRGIDPMQEEYSGLVAVSRGENGDTGNTIAADDKVYPYGISSLADKHEFLQKNDLIQFQITVIDGTSDERAANIVAVRKKLRAKVDGMKEEFGFLTYEIEGKKLFFHMSEVVDSVSLHPGDEVEFVLMLNQKSGKHSACRVKRLSERERPNHLIHRLRAISVGNDARPRLTIVRQPHGPDGTRGFFRKRTQSEPIQNPASNNPLQSFFRKQSSENGGIHNIPE